MFNLYQMLGEKIAASRAREDHGNEKYNIEEGELTIYVSGYYTIAELEQKVRQLNEANRLYQGA